MIIFINKQIYEHFFFKKRKLFTRVGWLVPPIPTLRKQKQVGACDAQATSLVLGQMATLSDLSFHLGEANPGSHACVESSFAHWAISSAWLCIFLKISLQKSESISWGKYSGVELQICRVNTCLLNLTRSHRWISREAVVFTLKRVYVLIPHQLLNHQFVCFFFKFIFVLFVLVFAWRSVSYMHALPIETRKGIVPLGLQPRPSVSRHVATGNWMEDHWKSNQCS